MKMKDAMALVIEELSKGQSEGDVAATLMKAYPLMNSADALEFVRRVKELEEGA